MLSLSDLRFILHFLEDIWTLVRICQANRIVVQVCCALTTRSWTSEINLRNHGTQQNPAPGKVVLRMDRFACNKLTKLTTLFMILRT